MGGGGVLFQPPPKLVVTQFWIPQFTAGAFPSTYWGSFAFFCLEISSAILGQTRQKTLITLLWSYSSLLLWRSIQYSWCNLLAGGFSELTCRPPSRLLTPSADHIDPDLNPDIHNASKHRHHHCFRGKLVSAKMGKLPENVRKVISDPKKIITDFVYYKRKFWSWKFWE